MGRSLRVLHIGSGNLYGGVETMLVTLARYADSCCEMEQQFGLCFPGRLEQELNQAGAKIHSLGGVRLSRPWTVWAARKRLKELLTREHFDAVICHMPWPLLIFGPVIKAKGVPLAVWVHNPPEENYLERWAARTVPDLAICNSQFTAGLLPRIHPGCKSVVLFYPVSLERAQTQETAARTQLRRDLGVPPDDVVIVQVSRLEWWKGHRLHIEALGKMKDVQGWQCWFVGGAQKDGESAYAEELNSSARKLGIADRVKFLGQRNDVSKLLAAADIFCQPNTGPEPFGIVFVEALAAGLPVVSTAIGGALEIVDENCGKLVPPDDAGSLALALGELIEDQQLRSKLGGHGPVRARNLCLPKKQIGELAQTIARMSGVRINGAETKIA